jgi:hypothetical protein
MINKALLENYCLHLFVYDGKIKIKKIENCKKTTIKRPPQKKKKKKNYASLVILLFDIEC